MEAVTDFFFLGSNYSRWWLQPWNQKIASWQESYDKSRQCVQKQKHHSMDKSPYSQGYGLPSGHIQLGELDCKEGRAPKNLCLKTMVLEKTPESPFNNKEIKPANLKRNQPWILIWRLDAEAEAPEFWSHDANCQFIGKVPDAGKDWGKGKKNKQDIRGYRCNGHELRKILGDGREQGGLACWVTEQQQQHGNIDMVRKKCFPLWLQHFTLPISI